MKWYLFSDFMPLCGQEILISDGTKFDFGEWCAQGKNKCFIPSWFEQCEACEYFPYKRKEPAMIFWTLIDRPPKRFRNVNASLKLKVLKRDNFKCKSCNRSPSSDSYIKLQVDHIIPFSKGGTDHPDNLQILCTGCNYEKRDN